MSAKSRRVIEELAKELKFSEEVILEESLKVFLEKKLREVRAEILQIVGKYGVSSVEEMEGKYKEGTLEEADTWRDLQRLDHLEYKRDYLMQLLKDLK